MKIIVANTAGFCMGVRRAVEMALDAPAKYPPPIYTFGPLIHNPQVLMLFADKGVTVLNQIPAKGEGTVIIRAHGVPPETKAQLKEAGFKVIDATCPRVVKVQAIIKRYNRKGYAAIIVGDQDHPEVISLLGFAGSNGHVVDSLSALQALPAFEQAIVVAQTTQNKLAYQEIIRWVAEHRPGYQVFETICDSTEKRQAEVRRLAQSVDALIVVGGKESGNTRRLAEIAAATGKPVYHVETEDEIDPASLASMNTIGITAGASTPTWIIKRVYRAVEQIPLKRWHGWLDRAMQLARFLILINLFVAIGAGCLCFAMVHLMGLPIRWPAFAAAFFYVLSMHTLNHLTGQDADKYNEPDRERFYQRFRIGLIAMAISAGALGLLASYQLGSLPFWTLLAISVLGLSYNSRFLPQNLLSKMKYRRMRDIPGSKTILIALAWGVVTTGVPALSSENAQLPGSLLAMFWAIGIVFCRTAFFDMLDIQGDRIVGKETLPIILGTNNTLKLLKKILILLTVSIVSLGAWGIFTGLAYAMAFCPLLLLLIIRSHEKDDTLPGALTEFKVESIFLLAGLMTVGYLYI